MKFARLGVLTVTSALALTALAPATAVSSSCWNHKTVDKKMASKINKARSNNGKAKMSLDPELSRVARGHSITMAKKNSLYHTNKLSQKVTNWSSLGENVGYGSGVKQLHNLFMNSSGHKANILNGKFRYVGVGSKRKGDTLWITVVFESKKNPGTTLGMPGC
jgi:uncharacterized protein YkwD